MAKIYIYIQLYTKNVIYSMLFTLTGTFFQRVDLTDVYNIPIVALPLCIPPSTFLSIASLNYSSTMLTHFTGDNFFLNLAPIQTINKLFHSYVSKSFHITTLQPFSHSKINLFTETSMSNIIQISSTSLGLLRPACLVCWVQGQHG